MNNLIRSYLATRISPHSNLTPLYVGILLTSSPLLVHATTVQPENALIQYYLELVINGQSSHHIAAVDYQHGNYYVSLQDLTATPVDAQYWQTAHNGSQQK